MAKDVLDTSPLMGDITHLGDDMLRKILERHRAAGQVATGRTSSTLKIVPTEAGFNLWGWSYAGSYDEGRAPGKMPPISAIVEWGRAKGIRNVDFKSEKQARAWAFGVAMRIAKSGTKRYQQAADGKRTDVFETPIKEMSEELEAITTRFYADSIRRELYRTDPKKK